MYTEDSLNDVSKEQLVEMLKETHAALCGLLWQIEDMRNFDDVLTESHFDDTVPMDRAQYVHKVLMSHSAAKIAERGFMRDERDEFNKWVCRCDVARSFRGAEKVFYTSKVE